MAEGMLTPRELFIKKTKRPQSNQEKQNPQS